MKRFFKNDTFEAQTVPDEFFKSIFKVSDENLEEAKKEKFVIQYSYGNDNFGVQIGFNTKNAYINNSYIVVIYAKDNNDIITCFGYPSHTVYPPVWDRSFSIGLDYTDFLGIQKTVNKALIEAKAPEFKYDDSPNKKSFNFTKEKPDEVKALLADGKPYGIVSIFAEKQPEMVENAKKFIEREYS